MLYQSVKGVLKLCTSSCTQGTYTSSGVTYTNYCCTSDNCNVSASNLSDKFFTFFSLFALVVFFNFI